jgi:hypothetical protein
MGFYLILFSCFINFIIFIFEKKGKKKNNNKIRKINKFYSIQNKKISIRYLAKEYILV